MQTDNERYGTHSRISSRSLRCGCRILFDNQDVDVKRDMPWIHPGTVARRHCPVRGDAVPLPASVQFKVDEMHENILGGITAGEMEFTAVQPVHLPPVVQPGLMAHPVLSPPGPRVLCRQHGAAQWGRCEGIPEIIDKEDCGAGFLHGRQQL